MKKHKLGKDSVTQQSNAAQLKPPHLMQIVKGNLGTNANAGGFFQSVKDNTSHLNHINMCITSISNPSATLVTSVPIHTGARPLKPTGATGMVFVTMTSSNTPLLSRSMAGGENTACDVQAYTSRAPS